MKEFLNDFKAFAFKGNMMDLAIGMIIGAALCYPTINGVDLSLFGLNLNATYTSTVLPVIITCFLAAPIEKFLNKVLPSVIRSFSKYKNLRDP